MDVRSGRGRVSRSTQHKLESMKMDLSPRFLVASDGPRGVCVLLEPGPFIMGLNTLLARGTRQLKKGPGEGGDISGPMERVSR